MEANFLNSKSVCLEALFDSCKASVLYSGNFIIERLEYLEEKETEVSSKIKLKAVN